MSVANNNPFQLLGVDGAEDAPVPPKAPAKTESAPRQVPGLPRAAAPAPAEEPVQRDQRGAGRGRGDRGHPSRGRDSRGGRGGRGGGRGGRGGRAFDRHSATGREDTAKSVRQGWGGEDAESEQKLEEAAKADAEKEEAADEQGADKKRVPEEEEDNTLTLDQYLASQAEKRLAMAAAAPRAVEADESYGQKLDKNEGESYFAGQAKKSSSAPRQRKEKQLVEIDASFAPPARAGGDRPPRGRGGARGGARGGRGEGRGAARGARGAARGGSRPAKSSNPAVNLADESAFPSLG